VRARIQHQAGLLEVSAGVGFDLLARQRRTGRVAPRRIADHRGEIADQEDHGVPEVLQLAHLVQHHRMAQVQVGRRRIQPQLDPQGDAGLLAARQLAQPFLFDQQFVTASQADSSRPLGPAR
jgi:hypothetical protein